MYLNFDLKTLESEYLPSSCIDDIGVYIQQYITQSQQALVTAKQENKVLENIEYGNSHDEVLDLFFPFETIKAKQKLHVYIHGGYWQELSKNESSFAATNFQQQGFHFAVINYSLAPNATLTEIVEQNRRSLVWLYQHAQEYGYDKNEIYLSGSSAGAHLAMMMAITDWSQYLDVEHNIVQGICAVSGIYDLTPIAQTTINDPLQLTELEITQNSPLLTDSNKDKLSECQVILAVGNIETNEFKRQTLSMKSELEEKVKTLNFKEVNERNHFDVILDLADENSWLSKQVFAQMECSRD
jgi:arylformamidase